MPLNSPNDEQYVLVSLDQTEPPADAEGNDWYRYHIEQGPNTITGYRRGSKRTVKRDVRAIVSQLNERRSGKRRGRVHLSRSSKPAKTSS